MFLELWLLPFKLVLCVAHPGNNAKTFVGPSCTDVDVDVNVDLDVDINIYMIKFVNEGTINYLTTLFSYRFLPYIALPSDLRAFLQHA